MLESRAQLTAFRRQLLAWYRRSRRELPWRRTRDPYRIWLSEVMLQQTRVATVLPYYRRFLQRFPTVRALARARGEEVLRHWAGLGYYRRARNLHRAAKSVVARHGGRFPSKLPAALGLPGIGGYTAAAILSIAYDAPLAVLDGNVARVLARLDALRGELRAPHHWKHLERRAQELLAPASPGDWNQAMMELGATVCTPRAPRCGVCPVARWCKAYTLGIAGELPALRSKRAPIRLRIAAAVLLDPSGRTLLVRLSEKLGGLFSGMWQFPAVEVTRDGGNELAQHLHEHLGLPRPDFAALPHARHTVTLREITLEPFLVRLERLPKIRGARVPPLAQLSRLPVSNATRKIAAIALDHYGMLLSEGVGASAPTRSRRQGGGL